MDILTQLVPEYASVKVCVQECACKPLLLLILIFVADHCHAVDCVFVCVLE